MTNKFGLFYCVNFIWLIMSKDVKLIKRKGFKIKIIKAKKLILILLTVVMSLFFSGLIININSSNNKNYNQELQVSALSGGGTADNP